MPRYLPVRLSHLVDVLADELFARDAAGRKLFYDLARLAADLERHFAGAKLRVISELYAPYDPDEDRVPPAMVSPEDDRHQVERLFDWIRQAFARANFEQVSQERLDESLAASAARAKKLKIDAALDDVEQLAIFHRGVGAKSTSLRPVKKLFRRIEVESPTYPRVGVVVRTRKDPYVHVKLYKDVAQDDIDIILPTVRLRMRLLDKVKLGGSGGAAAISFVKMVKLLLGLATLTPIKVLLLPVIVIVGVIYGGKTYLDYTKIRVSYLTALSEQLYSLTLGSNRGVLTHLSELAAEEDSKEVILGWALLQSRGALEPEELGRVAREWIERHYAQAVKFDVPDAVEKLEERGLVRREGTKVVALPVAEAVKRLDAIWDELYVPA